MYKLNSRVAYAAILAASPAMMATGAAAHPGDHHGMSFAELAGHLTSGWHLAVLAVAALGLGIGALVLRSSREAANRSSAAKSGERQ